MFEFLVHHNSYFYTVLVLHCGKTFELTFSSVVTLKEATHGQQFREDLFRNIRQNIGFDAVMRIRTSTGKTKRDFVLN